MAELAEEFVPFDRELSIVAVRGRDGETRFWPLVENVHREASSASRAPRRRMRRRRAAGGALRHAARRLDYVGVLAIELFEVGGAAARERVAPRVHNTGHWTIDGAATSQFENHLRAILGLPLGRDGGARPSVMVNLIGGMPPLAALLALPGRARAPLRQGAAPRPQGRSCDARRPGRGAVEARGRAREGLARSERDGPLQ